MKLISIVAITFITNIALSAPLFQCTSRSLVGRKFKGNPAVTLIDAQNSALNACHKRALVCSVDSCVVVQGEEF